MGPPRTVQGMACAAVPGSPACQTAECQQESWGLISAVEQRGPRLRDLCLQSYDSAPHLCFLGFCGPSRPWCLLTTTFGTPQAEMELVLRIGVPASKIIFANPCKQIAQIKYAAKYGIQLLSFDNEMELAKVVKNHPSAK